MGKKRNKALKKRKIKVRKFWRISPSARIKESGKKYNRKKKKGELKDIIKESL